MVTKFLSLRIKKRVIIFHEIKFDTQLTKTSYTYHIMKFKKGSFHVGAAQRATLLEKYIYKTNLK